MAMVESRVTHGLLWEHLQRVDEGPRAVYDRVLVELRPRAAVLQPVAEQQVVGEVGLGDAGGHLGVLPEGRGGQQQQQQQRAQGEEEHGGQTGGGARAPNQCRQRAFNDAPEKS